MCKGGVPVTSGESDSVSKGPSDHVERAGHQCAAPLSIWELVFRRKFEIYPGIRITFQRSVRRPRNHIFLQPTAFFPAPYKEDLRCYDRIHDSAKLVRPQAMMVSRDSI